MREVNQSECVPGVTLREWLDLRAERLAAALVWVTGRGVESAAANRRRFHRVLEKPIKVPKKPFRPEPPFPG